MGNSSQKPQSASETFQRYLNLKTKSIIKAKKKSFPEVQKFIAHELATMNKNFPLDKPLLDLLTYSKQECSLADCIVAMAELQNYLLTNLHNSSVDNNKDRLRGRKKEFFSFARHNMLRNKDFLMAKVYRAFQESSIIRYAGFSIENYYEQTKILGLVVRITNRILNWFYGEEIFLSLCPINTDPDIAQGIISVYMAELAESLLFSDKGDRNCILKLRNKQVEIEASRVKKNILMNLNNLKRADRSKQTISSSNLFPEGQAGSYQIILEYMNRMATAPLLTTKYKFICIIFETIPNLYLQSYYSKKKSYSRTFSNTPDYYGTPKKSLKCSISRNLEVENTISELLSADSKREIAKRLIVEWFRNTECDMLKDVLIPMKLIRDEEYIKDASDNHSFLAFLYALYETVGVDEEQNSEILL